MRAARTGAALLAAGVVVASVLARPALERRAHPRPRFTYSNAPLAEAAYAELAARPGWVRASLVAGEGVALRGLVRKPTVADRPWVVFFAGNDATLLARGQRVLESLRGDRDWGLVVYAYRGYDSSPGSLRPEALAADGARILDQVLEGERTQPSRVHLVAFSLGGYPALAAARHAAAAGQPVGSVSLMASIVEAEMVRSAWAARVAMGDVYDVTPLLADVPAPVLIVHGSRDEALGVGTGRDLAARLGPRARYVEIAGAGHQLTENDAALGAVRTMIEDSSLPESRASGVP